MATLFPRDDNYVLKLNCLFPIEDKDGLIISNAVTFAAATTGATGAHTLFTISGPCIVKVIGVCSADLTGSGTVEVGLTGNTAVLIAQTTGTTIDKGEFWIDNSPAVYETDFTGKLIATDIIETIGTDTITAGTITYYCYWRPMSPTSTCAAA